MFVGTTKSTVQKYREQVEELKKENAKLKEANDTFTLGARRTIESNCKLYKENQELKKEVEDHNSDNDVLIESIEKLIKERSENFPALLKVERDQTMAKNEKLEKEIEELKEKVQYLSEYQDDHPAMRHKVVLDADYYQTHCSCDYGSLEEMSEKIEKLIEDKDQMKKISNVKTDLINNLFSKIVGHADIDDGISISKDYGHKYIDEWNKMYEDVIKDTIEVMNEHELDCVLKFHDCGNIEFCMEDSDDDSDEEDE